MARRRRRRKSTRRIWILGILGCVLGVVGYSTLLSPQLEPKTTQVALSSARADGERRAESVSPRQRSVSIPRLTSNRPPDPIQSAQKSVREKGDAVRSLTAEHPAAFDGGESAGLVTAGLQAEQRGDWLTARAALSRALRQGMPESAMTDARAALTRIGTKTIFSGTLLEADPLVGRHTVASGETLAKIAKRYSVTADFLAYINDIRNKNLIRVGQNLKVVQGPFHARVHKATFRMDVELQGVFVAQYAVGLGAEGSTPSGEWAVGTKLTNPTYYPPRGGQIVAADDPDNPLGEFWIELKGIGGDALGQQRYGIHGTIDPASIGQNASMGCVRMHNDDVACVYRMFVPGKSLVITE